MEGARKHKQVIAAKLVQAGVEFAVVYQAAGLVDDEKRIDGPAHSVSRVQSVVGGAQAASTYMVDSWWFW